MDIYKYKINKYISKIEKLKYNSSTYLNTNNIIGGSKMIDYITTFFKMYNTITWDIGKLYVMPEIEELLKTYCRDLNPTNKCDPVDYQEDIKTSISHIPDNCCLLNKNGVSKRSVRRFDIQSIVTKDNVSINFVEELPKITTENYKLSLYEYIRHLIIDNLVSDNIDLITNILLDNDYVPNNKIFTLNEIKDIVNKNDFYDLDDIIKIVYPLYTTTNEYKRLKSAVGSPIHEIQQESNKLFKQKNIYHMYFSFGSLTFLKYVNWTQSLKYYVAKIKTLLESGCSAIILGCHSVGSYVIQKLAIELLNSGINVSNIYLIGTGSRYMTTLNDVDIERFRISYENRFIFVINGYRDFNNGYRDFNGIVYYDHSDYDGGSHMNRITTHIIICEDSDKFETNIDMCSNVNIYAINYEIDINSDIFKPKNSIALHDFKNYSQMFFKCRNIIL